MKKIVMFLTVLMIGMNYTAKGAATINFKTKVHDFGQIAEEKKTATVEFVFTNTGNSALVIHKAIASCGCTTPDYPREPIAAGASASIKVTYNTTGRPGAFHKTITIYSNDPENANTILVIKGIVIPRKETTDVLYPKDMDGLRLKRTNVAMLEAMIGSTRTETIEVINTNPTPMKISYSGLPKYIQIEPATMTLQPNETSEIAINYVAEQAKDYGKKEDSFYIVTDQKKKKDPNNRINVSAFIEEDFSLLSTEEREKAPVAKFSDNRLNLGKMTPNSLKVTFLTLSNEGKSPLFLRKIIPDYDGIKVAPEKKSIPAGNSIKVKIDFNAGTFNGNVVQRITFITNDPENSVNKVFVTAQVDGKQ